MHAVTWTYNTPDSLSPAAVRDLFRQTAERYIGVPGLVRKYFGLSEDRRQVIGIYIWNSKADADAFYSPEWLEGVSRRCAAPEKAEWEIPQVVESAEGRVITADVL